VLEFKFILCTIGGLVACWCVKIDKGNVFGDFRVFAGAREFWVLPRIGCNAWRHLA